MVESWQRIGGKTEEMMDIQDQEERRNIRLARRTEHGSVENTEEYRVWGVMV